MDNNNQTQPYELVGEHVSIFQRGNKWYAHYRQNGKPVRTSLKTQSKKEARRKAMGLERDLINGEARRPTRAPLITEVIDQYVAHLEAQQRSKKTIDKYRFAFKLLIELAEKRGIRRIDQVDLALIDAFRLARETHRFKPTKKDKNGKGQSKDDT